MMIIYILTIFILLFLSLIIKKSNNRQNIIIASVFAIGIYYFYNIFITCVLSLLKIKANFFILSVINIIVSCLIYIINRKNKKIQFQKYTFNIKEFIYLIIIISICIIIGLIRFDNFKSIAYETTDPAVHYIMASDYSENLMLLTKENSVNEMYDSFNRVMPGFYVNCGLLMKIFSFAPAYKIYLIFDVIVLCLLSITFYATCLLIKKVKDNNFLIFVISGLYLGAYCLNNLIFGFGYLGIGILAINLILLTWFLIEKTENIQFKKLLYILLFLFNYSLFFSYYLFVPVVYFSQGIYIIYLFIKKKDTFTNTLLLGTITLIIPFIIGFIYFILPGMLSTGITNTTSGIAGEGYIYRDLWSNFILLLPMLIYALIITIKEKKFDLSFFILIIQLAFIAITFIIGVYGKISSYYYFKSYFVLWLLIYLFIIRLINNNSNTKLVMNINIYYIAFILLISFSKVETKIQEKNILFNNSIASTNVVNIYWFNGSKIFDNMVIYSEEEMLVLEESKKYYDICLNSTNEFPMIGSLLQKLWYYSITDVVPIYNHNEGELSKFYEEEFDYNTFISDVDSSCLIVLNNTYHDYIDNNDYQILYQNNSGKILFKN